MATLLRKLLQHLSWFLNFSLKISILLKTYKIFWVFSVQVYLQNPSLAFLLSTDTLLSFREHHGKGSGQKKRTEEALYMLWNAIFCVWPLHWCSHSRHDYLNTTCTICDLSFNGEDLRWPRKNYWKLIFTREEVISFNGVATVNLPIPQLITQYYLRTCRQSQ